MPLTKYKFSVGENFKAENADSIDPDNLPTDITDEAYHLPRLDKNGDLPMLNSVLSMLAVENIAANDALALGTGQTIPVAYDNTANGNVTNNNSLTVSLTVGNHTNRVLIVAIGYLNTTSDVSTGVTYNGVAMTKIGQKGGSGGYNGNVTNGITLWKLVNPPVGTYNLVSTISNGSTHSLVAMSMYNVDQTTPVQAFNTLTTVSNFDSLLQFGSLINGSGGCGSMGTATFTNPTTSGTRTGINNAQSSSSASYGVYASFGQAVKIATTAVTCSVNGSWQMNPFGIVLKSIDAGSVGVLKANATSGTFDPALTTFIGFAKKAVSAAANVSVVYNGFMKGFTGLTIGATYYLSNTGGLIASAAGGISKKVGLAITDTILLIKNEN